jgi:pimeloyl-ACP methyl ester carboxylesterase
MPLPPGRQALRLEDGRVLAYIDAGATQSKQSALIYHHGWPSSASEARFVAGAAAEHGLRLVAFDRPGVGGSDHHPGRAPQA